MKEETADIQDVSLEVLSGCLERLRDLQKEYGIHVVLPQGITHVPIMPMAVVDIDNDQQEESLFSPAAIANVRWQFLLGDHSITMEELQKLAEEKKGKCLSTKYINNSTKLKWMCKNNHIWETVLKVIIKGHWCYDCNPGNGYKR